MAGSKRALVGLGIAWLVLVAFAVMWGVDNAEADLSAEVQQALDRADIEVGRVRVDGRDAVLLGVEASSSSRAVDIVERVRGVRTVDVQDVVAADEAGDSTADRTTESMPEAPASTIATTETAPATTTTTTAPTATSTTTTTVAAPTTTAVAAPGSVPTLSATLENGALTLAGAIPDAESAARIAAVADLIYGPFVTNDLVVDDSIPTEDWVPGAAGGIAVLPIVGSASLQITGDDAIVTAVAPTEIKQAQLVGAVQQALGESVTVGADIEITGKEPPFFAASAPGDGAVTLRGVMPDEAAAERIAGAAMQVFGPDNVVNEMTIGENIDTTFSLFRVPLVFVLFQPVPEWQFRIENDVITGNLRGGATFPFGSAALTPELEALSDIAAGILLRNPTLGITIAGHTDSIGSDEYNQQLSEDRAQAAVEYLAAQGVDAARMVAVGFGETQPIGDNGTAVGRAQNRRIEFDLGPIGGP